MREGVLQRAEKVIGRLRERRLAVRLAAVAQHDPKDVRLPPLAIGRDDRRTRAEIDLGFLAGGAFHPAERQRAGPTQTLHEPPHAVVADAAGVAAQILVNPPGAQSFLHLGGDQLAKRFTLAGRSRSRARAGRQVAGWFWLFRFRRAADGPVGRFGSREARQIGWFWTFRAGRQVWRVLAARLL